MDNIFEISRFDNNVLLVGYDRNEYDIQDAQQIQDALHKVLPSAKIVMMPNIQGIHLIKEGLL